MQKFLCPDSRQNTKDDLILVKLKIGLQNLKRSSLKLKNALSDEIEMKALRACSIDSRKTKYVGKKKANAPKEGSFKTTV